MKKLVPTFALLVASFAYGQGFPNTAALAGVSSPTSGSVKFQLTGTSLCMYSGASCGGSPVAGTIITYTVDGSPVTEASTYYTGPITVTPGEVINAALVQITQGGVSGVVVQDGTNAAGPLETDLACQNISAQCLPYSSAGNFSTMPTPVKYGSATSNNGTRGVPTHLSAEFALAKPGLDSSSKTSEFDLTTAGSTLAGGGSTGNTGVLIPNDSSANEGFAGSGGTTINSLTSFASDFYVGWNYTPASGTNYNAANNSDLELDSVMWMVTLGNATTCAGSTQPCYGEYALRCAIINEGVTSGGVTTGQWQHSGQTDGWQNFPTPRVTRDCSLPFGTLTSAQTATQTTITAAPGTTIYAAPSSGVNAWGIEKSLYVVLDSGLASEETEQIITNPSGNTATVRRGVDNNGVGKAHASGALWSGLIHIQYHSTNIPGNTTLCPASGSSKPNPQQKTLIDYLMIDGIYYGDSTYGTLYAPTANSIVPNGTNTYFWGTQTISGTGGGTGFSTEGDCFSFQTVFGENRFYTQTQLYTNAGSDVTSKISVFKIHDNYTGSFGFAGPLSQYIVP